MAAEPINLDLDRITVVHGTAAELHDRGVDEPPRFRAEWLVVTRPALVLGSAQPEATIDTRVAAAHGIEVMRRRSGGGSVLMLPGEMVWLDVVVPRGDPLWHDDVGRAMWWLGDLWQAALAACGVAGEVYRGSLVGGDLGKLVCFAGRGAGEVVAAGPGAGPNPAKLIGISQRRTRDAARLQSSAHLVWRPELAAALIADETVTAEAVAPLVGAIEVAARPLLAALRVELARLRTR